MAKLLTIPIILCIGVAFLLSSDAPGVAKVTGIIATVLIVIVAVVTRDQ